MKHVNDFWEGDFSDYQADVDYEDVLAEAGCLASSPTPENRNEASAGGRAQGGSDHLRPS